MSAEPFAPISLSPRSLLDSPPSDARSHRPEHLETDVASIREVLACLDGSDLGQGVVPHARVISRVLNARLTLLHVLESEIGTPTNAVPADPLEWGIRQREAKAHLDRVMKQFGEDDSDIRSELIQGRPAEQICGWARNHDIDLTVLCSHGSRGLTEWDLASTARKLIERVPGSLLLIPGAAAALDQHHEVRYRRILVPLDGSQRAESVIPTAMRIAASHDAEVFLAHVVPAPEIFRMGAMDVDGSDLERRVMDHNRRMATTYLERLRARASHLNSKVRSLVAINGSVRMKLAQMIDEEKVDLVVMSAHGKTGRTDTACGSVTEYELAHASVPLLVLRERNSHRMRRVVTPRSRSLERPAPMGSETL